MLRDARAAAILSHPNIVAVFDIVEEGHSVYVVMEYIEGESLASYLDHTPLPDPVFIMQVLRQMAAGLDYTHSKGIIHRDIKPANVMVSPGGGVKILDFGIARMNDVRTSTPTGVVMGTVDYMAPEQIKASLIDGRADQYSMAAVAYRMMAGSTLFGRHTLATLTYKLVNEAPQPVCQRNSTIPAAVDQVLAKALSKTPDDRYPTCGAFIRELGQALFGALDAPTATLTAVNEVTVKTPPTVETVPRKSSKTAALVAGGLLLAAGAGGLAIWRPWNQPAPVAPTVPPPVPVEVEKASEKPPVEPSAPDVKAPEAPPKIQTKAPNTGQSEIKATKVAENQVKPSVTPAKPEPAKDHSTEAVVHPMVTPPVAVAKVSPPAMPVAPPQPPPEKTPETQANGEKPMYESSPEEAPGKPFQRGLEQMKAKDYQAAIQTFTIVLKNRPNMAPAFFNRGFAHEMANEATLRPSKTIRTNPPAGAAQCARLGQPGHLRSEGAPGRCGICGLQSCAGDGSEICGSAEWTGRRVVPPARPQGARLAISRRPSTSIRSSCRPMRTGQRRGRLPAISLARRTIWWWPRDSRIRNEAWVRQSVCAWGEGL